MNGLRPRLRALAALVALCLSVGPAASALCPHPDGEPAAAHAMPDMPMPDGLTAGHEMPPCHDVPAPETPESDDADCASPCCVTAEAPAPATPQAPTADVSQALPAQSADMSPTASPVLRAAVPPRAPPRPVVGKSVRLRV